MSASYERDTADANNRSCPSPEIANGVRFCDHIALVKASDASEEMNAVAASFRNLSTSDTATTSSALASSSNPVANVEDNPQAKADNGNDDADESFKDQNNIAIANEAVVEPVVAHDAVVANQVDLANPADPDPADDTSHPIAYVSNVEISKLPEDCLVLILTELSKDFSELISKSFVSFAWLNAVRGVLQSTPRTSLKLFDHIFNIDRYREEVLKNYEMSHSTGDARFLLSHEHEPVHLYPRVLFRGPEPLPHDDALIIRQFTDVSIALITNALSFLFPHVTFLVMYSINIDQVAMLVAFSQITTLTLVELPDCLRTQRDMWQQLATMTELRHLHIFSGQPAARIAEDEIAPVLVQLESFTLVNYENDNLFKLIGRLSPERVRTLRVGRFTCDRDSWQFREALRLAYPEVVAALTTAAGLIMTPKAVFRIQECSCQGSHRFKQVPEQYQEAVRRMFFERLDRHIQDRAVIVEARRQAYIVRLAELIAGGMAEQRAQIEALHEVFGGRLGREDRNRDNFVLLDPDLFPMHHIEEEERPEQQRDLENDSDNESIEDGRGIEVAAVLGMVAYPEFIFAMNRNRHFLNNGE